MPHVVTLLLGLMLALSGSARAGTEEVERARAAVALFEKAADRLAAAETARDRVQALTGTISAYEEGLMALRSVLPRVALRHDEVSAQLADQEADTARLLAMLMRLESNGSPVALLHPGGAAGAARGGMLMAGIAPVLDARADSLRATQAELQMLETLQTDAQDALQGGLDAVRTARDRLNVAISERAPMPKRFVADPVREAILISSARTLDSFAENLDKIAVDAIPAVPGASPGLKGALPMPVNGTIRHGFGEADAAGVPRSGLVIDTPAGAIVTSPSDATLRYAGPLLDLGFVVILEPMADVLIVLAGLGSVYGETGDMIAKGAPVGLTGGVEKKSGPNTSIDGEEAGLSSTETLYIEVRERETPVDPTQWFRTQQNG